MIKAEIIQDSINKNADRLTTFVLEYPRFIHAELMTHRVASKNAASCLTGDSLITVNKPSHIKRGRLSAHQKIPIKEIVDKWFEGDSKGRNMKHRLRNMNIRCLNEDTGEFISTHIVDCFRSGKKSVYEIELENGYKIKCTKEHRIFGSSGWFTLNDINLTETSFGLAWDVNTPKIATNGVMFDMKALLELKDKGYGLKQICEMKNWNFKSISSICEKHRIFFKKKLTPDETFEYKNYDWMKTRLDEGLFSYQIAELCNTTVDRVKKSIKKLGLKGNKWNWGLHPTWNKGLTYTLPDDKLINVRKAAKKRIKKESYKEYNDSNVAIIRFLMEIREEIMEKYNWKCQLSGSNKNLELHHIDPVWHNKDLALDKENIIPITKRLHRLIHSKNLDLEFLEWYNSGKPLNEFILKYNDIKLTCSDISKPVGTQKKLMAGFYGIKKITYIGEEETYDLEVEGPYHNFVANNIVVHNSRATPVATIIQRIQEDPAMPVWWGKNQSGMQAKEELSLEEIEYCKAIWLESRDMMISQANKLFDKKLHKQITNRILEPWFNIKVVFTATDYDNLFALRVHKDAQPEFKELATLMLNEYNNSKPKYLKDGEWHIPFGDSFDTKRLNEVVNISDDSLIHDDKLLEAKIKIAIARCARTSYINFEGNDDYFADIKLCDRLFGNVPRHLSPTEHVAYADSTKDYVGNLKGFVQYRKLFKDECLIDNRVNKWKVLDNEEVVPL